MSISKYYVEEILNFTVQIIVDSDKMKCFKYLASESSNSYQNIHDHRGFAVCGNCLIGEMNTILYHDYC